MANSKYISVLEELNFIECNSNEPKRMYLQPRLSTRIAIVKKFLKSDPKTIAQQLSDVLNVDVMSILDKTVSCEEETLYLMSLMYIMLKVTKGFNFESDAKEDLVSAYHINLCILALKHLTSVGLSKNLHPIICNMVVFDVPTRMRPPNFGVVHLLVIFFAEVLKIKQFHIANSMEQTLLFYMAAVYTLIIGHHKEETVLTDEVLRSLKGMLDMVWDSIAKEKYFKNSMIIRGIPNLPYETRRFLNREMIVRIMRDDGFALLVLTFQAANQVVTTHSDDKTQSFELIAKILASYGHKKEFVKKLVPQILLYMKMCLNNEELCDTIAVGPLSLRKLYDLNEDNKSFIREQLYGVLKCFIDPPDVLTGAILMDYEEFSSKIAVVHQLFCISIMECLPSVELIKYLPMLLDLFTKINKTTQRNHVIHLVTRCLDNRTKDELENLIKKIFMRNFDESWVHLHKRIEIRTNDLQFMHIDKVGETNLAVALTDILKTEKHYTLIYYVFLILLELIGTELFEQGKKSKNIDLIASNEELESFLLNDKLPMHFDILNSLAALIELESLKSQLTENTGEFLQAICVILDKRIKATFEVQSSDETIILLLTVVQEVLENIRSPHLFKNHLVYFEQLENHSTDALVKERIKYIRMLIRGDVRRMPSEKDFDRARRLIENAEPYLQVQGMRMLMDLIKKNDKFTLDKTHIIVLLVLDKFKNKESFTFLNSILLLSMLVGKVKVNVIEILCEEYCKEEAEVDYRLVVGEALIKVCEKLGPLCYKHKDLLLNCFLNGARSHLDEYRMSSYANLGQICRILSYQVQNIFQELLMLINGELTSGKYIPSQRAAVLVLSEVLNGVENLLEFDGILPIHGILKSILNDANTDDQMRVHASNGLETINNKCKELFFPEQKLEKPIQVLNINENRKKDLKKHILELN